MQEAHPEYLFISYMLITIITIIAITISAAQHAAIAKQIPGAYMIEYASQPHSIIHSRILASLQPLSNLFTIRHTYSSDLFHGVSIYLQDSVVSDVVGKLAIHPVLQSLVGHPDIQNVYPIQEVSRPQWIGSPVHLPFENKLSQFKDIHKTLNITGSGITVGILDSGMENQRKQEIIPLC